MTSINSNICTYSYRKSMRLFCDFRTRRSKSLTEVVDNDWAANDISYGTVAQWQSVGLQVLRSPVQFRSVPFFIIHLSLLPPSSQHYSSQHYLYISLTIDHLYDPHLETRNIAIFVLIFNYDFIEPRIFLLYQIAALPLAIRNNLLTSVVDIVNWRFLNSTVLKGKCSEH